MGFRKIWQRIKKFVSNRYEAAYQKWGERSWLASSIQDARFDADAATRLELLRRHRYWVQNNEIVQRVRNLKIQFSVGVEGLQVVANSSNEKFNALLAASYKRWCESPEIGPNSTLPMGQLHRMWAGADFDAGELFIYLTSERGVPKLQTIESHRIYTPPGLKDREGKTIFDGVLIDPATGEKLGFYVRDQIDELSFKLIPAENMIQIYDALRPGMMRGIAPGFSCMNRLHDMDDLHMLEMRAAKDAASVSNVITTASGEAPSPANMRRVAVKTNQTDANGNNVTVQDAAFYQTIFGTRTVALRKGETMEQFQSNRPSVVTQQYWDYLTSLICIGYNVPKLLVLPYSLQGTVARADLDICTNAFRPGFERIKLAAMRVYRFYAEWAIKFDRSIDVPIPDDGTVFECIVRPPRAPNVDVGRNAQALALELKTGVTNYQTVFAERQQDWRQEFRQAAECARYLHELADEFSDDKITITVDEIAQKLEDQIDPPAQAEQKEQLESV